jgi:hypothetical protein
MIRDLERVVRPVLKYKCSMCKDKGFYYIYTGKEFRVCSCQAGKALFIYV